MSHFFYIATRDPVNSADSRYLFRQAAGLAKKGASVSVFLVQNGALAARLLADDAVRSAHQSGVRIMADEFSLRERGISAEEIQAFVEPRSMDEWLAGVLAADSPRLIWH